MSDSHQLLAAYVETGSEPDFQELVKRYVDLVYSTAVRLVNRDLHLAEDVAQTVFIDFARLARTLPPEVMLGGWLHRHTCFVAAKHIRTERRRQSRERQAVEMNAQPDHTPENLAQVAPLLDDAIDQLGAEDRAAILLRFFEQHDFRTVGEKLGSNEEAARKRVNRALDKLHLLLKHRGVAFSGATLGSILTTQAVTAAPPGLALGLSGVALATVASGGGGAVTFLKIMSMTKLKMGVVGTLVAAGLAIPLAMQHQEITRLRQENQALRQSADGSARHIEEQARLAREGQSAPKNSIVASAPEPNRELVKLRGEVGRLRQENANATKPPTGDSALSSMTTNPEMKKLLRDQQKMGMAMMYSAFAKELKLPKEQTEKLNDLLADSVMDNVDTITEVLRDGKSVGESDQLFAAREAELAGKIGALLGEDKVAQFEEYTRNMGSHLTAEQFKGMLSGEKDAKEAKAKQLYEVMKAETESALASAGLSPNFQTVPMMNFRNFPFETEADKNVQLLATIYANATTRSAAFLSEDEVKKFREFQSNAINGSKMSLALNRKMMMPGAK